MTIRLPWRCPRSSASSGADPSSPPRECRSPSDGVAAGASPAVRGRRRRLGYTSATGGGRYSFGSSVNSGETREPAAERRESIAHGACRGVAWAGIPGSPGGAREAIATRFSRHFFRPKHSAAKAAWVRRLVPDAAETQPRAAVPHFRGGLLTGAAALAPAKNPTADAVGYLLPPQPGQRWTPQFPDELLFPPNSSATGGGRDSFRRIRPPRGADATLSAEFVHHWGRTLLSLRQTQSADCVTHPGLRSARH